MKMSILSQCSGRGFVHFFAMAALLNVALTNLKNGLVRQNANFFPDPSVFRTTLGPEFDGFSEFY